MKKLFSTFLIMLFVCSAVAIADDDIEELYGVNVDGTWASDKADMDRYAEMEFDGTSFQLTMVFDGETTSMKGLFTQESKKILLVVDEGNNHQSQMEMPYYVIDTNTIEVTINNKTFLLERVS